MSRHADQRAGFSLMEMVIATAVLAASGAALFTLVGQASQFAGRAEERTVALQMAQSTLDEFLASGSEFETEMEGSFESDPRWSYRIEQSEVAAPGQVVANEQAESELKRIVVSIHRSSDPGGASSNTTGAAIVRLVRWVRVMKSNGPTASPITDAMESP